MPDNDPTNDAADSKEAGAPKSDRPLGKLSGFRGNTDNANTARHNTTARRPAESSGNELPEQQLPEQHGSEQQPPRTDSPQQDAGFERNSPPPPPPAVSHHRTGTGMYWAAALIALALLTLFFNNRLENKQLSEGITEKLLQQANGHYYARGQINNQPVLFIVDTGASVISIPATLADSMGLPRLEPEQVNTANGVITVFNTRPVTIRLGDIQLYDVEAHINPGMEPPGVLLGMSFLRRLDFRQRDTRLILKTRAEP